MKTLSLQAMEKKLDMIFSQYIRLRDSDDKGYCVCISCTYVGYWEKDKIQNGHYVPRGLKALRFDEDNCNAQCEDCNIWREKERVKVNYSAGLLKKIGAERIERLNKMAEFGNAIITKRSEYWYAMQISEYGIKIDELKALKGI